MKISPLCRAVLGLAVSVVSTGGIYGQAKPGGAAGTRDPYAAESMVVERQDAVYTMAADGTGVHEMSLVARVQNDAGLHELGVIDLPFAGNSEHVEFVYVRARHRDGTVTETPASAAIEVLSPVTQAAPFYSDLKQMQLPVRTLGIGDTLEWKARIVRTKPEAPGEFWGEFTFLEGMVGLEESVELRFPKDKYVNAWSLGKKPSDTVVGDQRVIRWETASLEPTVGAAADAAKEAKKKHVLTEAEELDEREGKLPDIAWTTFKSWQDVGAWYRGLEADRMAPNEDIKAKVADLTAGKTTERQKIEAVYDFVSTGIRYIGVAFGVGRFQPHAANTVLENQYGDCKDKHTLLAAMLLALGEKPDAVLIGAGIRFNEAVPSPAAFNHLITRLTVDGKPVFLDSTAEVAPFGMLLSSIRDEQALAIPDQGVAMIVRTPADPPFQPYQQMEAKGSIDAEGTSESHIVITMHGDEEVAIRQVLRQIGPDKWDLLMGKMVQAIGYAGTESHADFTPASDLSQPLKMSFDYKRVKSGDWDHLKIVPQLYPVILPRPSLTEPPTESIQLGPPRVERSTSELKLPPGWGAELPEAVHRKSPYATLDVTYRFEKGTVYAERKLEVLKEKVPVSDWKTYSAWAEAVDLGNESFIQLTPARSLKSEDKKVPSAEAPGSDPGGLTGEAKARALYTQVWKILDDPHGVAESAKPLLDQIEAINPKELALWSGYGYVCFRDGDLPCAVKSYRQEVANHPENDWAYSRLVQAQLALKQKDDAKETLRQWAAAEPANATPTLQLGSLLIDEGAYSAAADAAQAALAQAPKDDPPNESIEVLLGRAELKAGMKEKGRDTLLAVIRQTNNPGIMNDAAYELADTGVELPLAEKTTLSALAQMEEQSQSWTLDENLNALKQKTRLMQATWDTVGWIYFRNGNLDQAERYIRPAWRGRPDAEVGKHLAELDLVRGKQNDALNAYELARATFPAYDAMGVHAEPGAPEKQISARIDELRKAGAKSSIGDAHDELQKMRRIPLGASQGMSGVAEYKMLVADGSVERAEPAGEKTLKGGAERLLPCISRDSCRRGPKRSWCWMEC